MNVLSNALRQTSGSIRLIGLIYCVTLVLGLLVTLPFYNTLNAEAHSSMAFLKLLDGFNYTVYSDFMHNSQKALSPLFSVGRLLGVLYIFLSIFFAGGILLRFAQPGTPFNAGSFWQGCAEYVGRFLKIFGVTMLFILVETIIWLLAGSLAGFALSDSLTERGLFWIGAVFFALFLLTSTLLLCIGDYAKVLMFREDERNPFRAFGRAGRLVLKNIARTYGLYWLLILIGSALFGIYFLLDALIPMSNWGTVLLMFMIQQSLIFARTGLKVLSLGVTYTVYESLPHPILIPTPITVITPASASDDESQFSTV
ncbi:hypothetical protein [Spirosoma spitsbergense]|uniref:hypothetical protein n=1 Tax=Spirosoma spitsbergense TaxID=431554 RepID=UPI0004771491|nr:hypothetical protein [Spirosoma spitsbergense]